MIAVAELDRQHAADERHRQRQEGERRQAPAPEGRLQQQEDPDARRRSPTDEQPLLRGLPLLVLTEDLGVVPERERRRSRARSSTSSRHGAEIASARRWRSTSIRRESGLALDHVRGRLRCGRRRRRRGATCSPSGVSIGSSLDARQAVARLGRAPDVDVVGPARRGRCRRPPRSRSGRRRAPDVAGLQAVALRGREVDLDLHLRDVGLELDVLLDDAVDLSDRLLRPPRPVSQDRVEVVARRCGRRSPRSLPSAPRGSAPSDRSARRGRGRGSRRRPPGRWRASRRSRRPGSTLIQFSPK